ncbi:MAG: 3-dehydroquinate synthase [Lachnospiraceae bacterium]|nr:3-dehydroquinate synthase [Lachnospiraceae bacterium]
MSRTVSVSMNKKPIYDIKLEQDFAGLAPALEELGFKDRNAVLISDDKVSPMYSEEVTAELSKVFEKVTVLTFPAGEESKNLDSVTALLRGMLAAGLKRSDAVVALGGGVTGDMAGFCAAIYMRGISVIQIPTSLLSMVDSSIGGKTGVDLDQYKNMVGAFKMPSLVYINTSVLRSLDKRQFNSGMGEVLKYGLIMDASFYEWLLSNMVEIDDRESAVLEEMIEHCCICKQRIVERDPFEQGDRALLNFGHTIGHAIEKYKDFKLLHGECVALGSVAAAYISWQKGRLSKDEYYEIRDMFVPFGLPISIDDIDDEEILKLTKSDKKAALNGIKFILLKRVGKAYIEKDLSDEDILAGIKEIHYVESND